MPTAREIASRFWLDTFSKADLERAIQAAIADERDACAKIADAHNIGESTTSAAIQSSTAAEIAALIRKRSQ